MKLVFFIMFAIAIFVLFEFFDISQFFGVFNGMVLSPLTALVGFFATLIGVIFSFYYIKIIFMILVVALIFRFVLNWLGGE